MSDCNRCSLRRMIERANKREEQVIVTVAARGYHARYTGEARPSAWYQSLGADCECSTPDAHGG